MLGKGVHLSYQDVEHVYNTLIFRTTSRQDERVTILSSLFWQLPRCLVYVQRTVKCVLSSMSSLLIFHRETMPLLYLEDFDAYRPC